MRHVKESSASSPHYGALPEQEGYGAERSKIQELRMVGCSLETDEGEFQCITTWLGRFPDIHSTPHDADEQTRAMSIRRLLVRKGI